MINEKFIEFLTIGYLFLFSLYHIATGVIAIFFPKLALKFNKILYGFQPIETRQLVMTFKPWGNLALVTGIIGFITFFNIDSYYLILFGFGILLVIRVWYRILMRKQLYGILKITPYQNWRMIVIQILGVILFLAFGFSKIL